MAWQTQPDPERVRGWAALGGFALLCALTIGFLVLRSSRDVLDLKPAAELALGRGLVARLEQFVPPIEAPAVRRLVEATGATLVRSSERPDLEYRFRVFDVADINAFALPGGFICINRGLIEAVADEQELAGVLAHEIVHVERRHAVQALRRATFFESLFNQLGGQEGAAAAGGAQVFALGMLLSFSSGQEEEADRRGAELMHLSGHDPRGLIRFFQRVAALQRAGGSGLGEFFDPHGRPEERIRWVHEEMERLGTGPVVIPSFSELGAAQSQLRALPPPPLFNAQAIALAFEEELKKHRDGSPSPSGPAGPTMTGPG